MNPTDKQHILTALQVQMTAAGITTDELAAGIVSKLPTVTDAVANIKKNNTYTAKTVKTYTTGWDLLVVHHGERHLDELTFEDIEQLAKLAKSDAEKLWERRNVPRRLDRQRPYDHDGSGAYESFLHAVRAVYKREYRKAERPVESSPVHRVDIPSRKASHRRPLARHELTRAFDVALSGGDDPLLDGLLLRTGYESGARQEGLVNLRLMDLDRQRQTATLDEKYGKKREQPITRELLDELVRFAHERGAIDPEDRVFRYRPRGGAPGRPLTARRFDTLRDRLRDSDPILGELHFVFHLLRHTIGRRISRVAGKAVARDFLGHAGASGDVTDGYTRALKGEVAAAWATVMGVDHPLADGYDSTW